MGLFDFFRRKKKVKAERDVKEAVAEAKAPATAAKESTVELESPETKATKLITKAEKPITVRPDPPAPSTNKREEKATTDDTVTKKDCSAKASVDKASKPIATEETIPEVDGTELEGDTVSESKPTRTGKFEIKRAKDGRYHFNLYASNHILIARSQVYSSSTKAMQGINSVIANAPRANIEDQTLKNSVTVPFPKWEIYIDNGGKYRFRLCAPNGSCICHSRGYTTKANCKNGIESITRFANDAEIKKVYLDKK